VDALTQRECEVRWRELSEDQARDVTLVVRVEVDDHALLVWVVQKALSISELLQALATTKDLASSCLQGMLAVHGL
jgi:hypothetical protein